MDPRSGHCDARSTHVSAAVGPSETKWVLQKWYLQQPIAPDEPKSSPGSGVVVGDLSGSCREFVNYVPPQPPQPPGASSSAGESRSLMSEAAGESVCPPALMILDWDDTLYPTSAIGAAGYDVTDPRKLDPGLERQIGQHCDAVLQFLQLVSERADRVVMVTNSQEGWV